MCATRGLSGTLHTTVLHPGLSPTGGALDARQPAPTQRELQAELAAARQLAARFRPERNNLSLIVDRLVLTSSGPL